MAVHRFAINMSSPLLDQEPVLRIKHELQSGFHIIPQIFFILSDKTIAKISKSEKRERHAQTLMWFE